MNSIELSNSLRVTPQYVQLVTKKAIDKGVPVVNIRGEKYLYSLVEGIGGRGKVYSYTPIRKLKVARKPKRKITNPRARLNPNDLPQVQNLDKPTVEEKIAIVSFCNVSIIPLGHIAKAYVLNHNSEIKVTSLTAKFKRWIKIFKTQGKNGLIDKRGGKDFKADLDLVRDTIYQSGNKHYTSQYHCYCFNYAKKHNLATNMKNPTADISYSAFVRSCEYIIKTDQHVRDFLKIGMDAFTYAEPSFGSKWDYSNQQWEIGATKKDILVKVPVKQISKNKAIRDYSHTNPSEDYQLVRMQIIGIIDNFSGATVYELFQSSNSYSNIRLLLKAFKKLGMPEVIKGDNGRDYVSKHFQDVVLDLGINYINTPLARGDKKGKIERSFKTLQHSPEFECMAGFVGHNVAQRQHLEAQSSTKLEKLSGVASNIKGEYLWWWELANWLDNLMEDKQKGKYLEHTPLNEQQEIDTFRVLGKKSIKRVSKEGIRHNNTHYLSYEMWQKVQIGDRVSVREHIDDSSTLFLFEGTEYLGEIKDKNIFARTQTIEEIKATQKEYKQRIVSKAQKTAKAAQKNYGKYQNAMRNEYLDIEAQQIKVKKETKNTEEEQIRDKHSKFVLELVS